MDGYFTDDSMLRRVVRERVVALSGPRALLVMAAHPVAWQGFFAHTESHADPYARLERTAVVMNAIGFGSREEADRKTRRVRAMHAKARGSLREDAGPFPAGTPYAADDPALLLWILAALAESAMLVYQKYVQSLSGDELEALWQDYRVVARLFGIPDDRMPADYPGFRRYMDDMYASGDLFVTPQARELSIEIVMRPPVPVWAKGLLELVNQITVGLLPGDIRRQYGFSWDPARAVALHGGAEYVKRVVVPLLPENLRLVPVARTTDVPRAA
jgi:uncharacterized protein (DUF2236 family)